MTRLAVAIFGLVLAFWPTASLAADAGTLTIAPQDQQAREYTLEDLDSMPQETIRTKTVWTEGVVEFSGVVLAHLLADAGIKTGTVKLSALNDYSVEFPVDEAGDDYPIVATRINGEAMPVREKGPFWVIYPYDQSDDFRTETIYIRSIWQLNRIVAIE
ncbi:MAG: molybdopterin-dependent oxidoreductase [Pseudomonadota bacterium]